MSEYLHPDIAYPWAYVAACAEIGEEAITDHIWDCIGYATRYGKGTGLKDALELPYEELTQYLRALSRIVDAEVIASKAK